MIRRICSAMIAAALVLGAPAAARAQGAPVQAASPPPPPAPKVEIPSISRAPGDSDVAVCVDGTWIKQPGVPSDCSAHGGLHVAMPPKPVPPPPPVARPAFRAVPVQEGPPPDGATARCKDGSYLVGLLAPDACADRGGLVVRFPPPRVVPPKPPGPPGR